MVYGELKKAYLGEEKKEVGKNAERMWVMSILFQFPKRERNGHDTRNEGRLDSFITVIERGQSEKLNAQQMKHARERERFTGLEERRNKVTRRIFNSNIQS